MSDIPASRFDGIEAAPTAALARAETSAPCSTIP